MFSDLLASDDIFEASIPVYTWNGAEIIERYCEETGWPNVTHDGDLMYENQYSTDRSTVIEWARQNAILRAKRLADDVQEAEERLRELRKMHRQADADIMRINAEHPVPDGHDE